MVISVSVIVPCFNAAEYLSAAINSVLEQAFSAFELIVVDDGSTDRTETVLRNFSDRRLRVIRQDRKGVSAARNRGLQIARGAYVCFLDADDLFLKNKLSSQKSFLDEHAAIGLVAGGMQRIDANGRIVFTSVPVAGEVSLAEIVCENQFAINAVMARTTEIRREGGFDAELRGGEDWDLFCRMALGGTRMCKQREVVCAYRLRRDSASMDPGRHGPELVKVVEKTFLNPRMPESTRRLHDRALAQTRVKTAMRYYECGQPQEGNAWLKDALRDYPETLADGGAQFTHTLVQRLRFAGCRSAAFHAYAVVSSLLNVPGVRLDRDQVSLYRQARRECWAALRRGRLLTASLLLTRLFLWHRRRLWHVFRHGPTRFGKER